MLQKNDRIFVVNCNLLYYIVDNAPLYGNIIISCAMLTIWYVFHIVRLWRKNYPLKRYKITLQALLFYESKLGLSKINIIKKIRYQYYLFLKTSYFQYSYRLSICGKVGRPRYPLRTTPYKKWLKCQMAPQSCSSRMISIAAPMRCIIIPYAAHTLSTTYLMR